MAAAIDFYNNTTSTQIFSDPLREELMKALEPFMKSASSSSPNPSSSSPSALSYASSDTACSFLSPDYCSPYYSTNMTHMFSQEFGNYKPLPSSVDAKLQAICQNLVTNSSHKQQPAKSCESEIETKPVVVVPQAPSSSSPEFSSDTAGSSSPESEISFLDYNNSNWEHEMDNFGLEKCPSVEIDWEAIRKLSE
ncbi:hypothetical protein Pint_26612 [Pistacia integerrima]|uniref:Uncharacterized protein n=1 Tax=Pistacia integerrima TaxID=434235 RepID=A0ACC0YV20_9ROSI|nr:hypothetical protein Pint_26612 [Pistacia integerrima]